MSLEYASHYQADPSYKIQSNTLTWPTTPVKLVTVDDNSITIEYEEHSVTLNIWGSDTRDKLDVDTTPCDRPSEGCCFEHSGCGYEKCSTHYPLQEITFRFDTKQLLNNGVEVPLSVTNSLPGSRMTIYITNDY